MVHKDSLSAATNILRQTCLDDRTLSFRNPASGEPGVPARLDGRDARPSTV
jgi:hypothetical protein